MRYFRITYPKHTLMRFNQKCCSEIILDEVLYWLSYIIILELLYSYNFRFLIYCIKVPLKPRRHVPRSILGSVLRSFSWGVAWGISQSIPRCTFLVHSFLIKNLKDSIKIRKRIYCYEYSFYKKTNIFWPILCYEKNFSQSNICLQIVVAKWLFLVFSQAFGRYHTFLL